MPSENTSLAFVKSLLLQLLDRNIGDVQLYTQVVQAYEKSKKSGGYAELEDDLWRAFSTGIQTVASSKANLVILVDGLDDVVGGKQAAAKLFKRLHSILEKRQTIRSVIFSRKFSEEKPKGVREIRIAADHVRDDIGRLVKSTLESNPHYKHRSNEEKDKVVDRLLDTAKDSFLWAVLVLNFLTAEETEKGFQSVLDHVPSSLQGLLERLVSQLDFSKTETKRIFAWLSVAERPLTQTEVKDLLEINIQQRTITERPADIQKEIKSLCGQAVVVRHGIVRYRHRAIQDHIADMAYQNKLFMPIKEAHAQMALRLVTYVKISLKKPYDLSFDMVDASTVDDAFRSHGLLEYAIRHWTYHFQESSMYGKDRLTISEEFKAVFPNSALFILIEWACWQSQTSVRNAITLHSTSLRVREAVFGEKHESVLQCLIVLGSLYRTLSNLTEAGTCFYHASTIGQSVLRKYSTITVSCTELFLTCTETITFTSRTEIATYREQMLRFIIEVSKHRHGATHDIVIQYYRLLAKLYVSINEEHHATTIYHELYEIIIKRYGKSSEEAKEVSEKLTVVLRKDQGRKEAVGYRRSIFETCEETLEIWDARRIQITLELAWSYEAQGDFHCAEEVLIKLWWQITEACRGKKNVEIHIAKIDIAIAYFRFLQRMKRTEEAVSILICIWTEYEHETYGSEVIILRLKTIGQLLKTVGLFSIAISIFTSVWAWFKRSGKTDHEAGSITVLISETLEEEVKTTTTTVVKEETVREVFETTFTRCKTTKKYTELIKACKSLAVYFIQLQRYAEAIEICHRSLEITWSVVLTGEGSITLPSEHASEIIIIVHRLAECHRKQGHFELAERFYLRVYRACLTSLKITDEILTNASMVLIRFYEEHHRHKQAIEIYKELLERYKAQLGAKHTLTIKTLYMLASLCLSYGWEQDAYTYYREIVTVLNHGHKHCHHDAVEAAVILIKWYHQEKRWKELQETCTILWETYVHHHHGEHYHFTEEMVIVIYEKYRYVLEYHAKVEFSVLYKISIEYRDVSIKVFGASTAIIAVALLELATVCEKSEKHYHEAVTIYEEIIRKKTTVTTTAITEVKRRLTRVYITITKSGSSSPKTIESAITLLLERYEALNIEFGCWHEKTLYELRELMLLYRRQSTKESHAIVVRMLQSTVVEIITKEVITERLYHAAITVAKIFIACELPEHGFEILRQLRLQLIMHDDKGCSFTLDRKVGRSAYVFIVAFELTLRGGKGCTYSDLMTDLLTETYLYEHFTRVVKSESNVEVIITHGARLRAFLAARDRKQQLETLDTQLYNLFKKEFGSVSGVSSNAVYIFYLALLRQLGRERVHHHGLGHAACISSTEKVKTLLEEGRFQDAYDVGECTYQFTRNQNLYRHTHNIGYGWKLALYLAGRGNVHVKGENKIKGDMLALSQKILREVLVACRHAEIDFVQVKLEELNELIALLGDQKNWADLSWLLSKLWNSREVQKTWSQDLIVNIGTQLVHAYHYDVHDSKHNAKAIRLCEDLVYNLRRALGFGPLHPTTLRLSKLLSSLYTDVGRHRDAMAVHEEILRLALYGDDDGDDDGLRHDEEVAIVREHLEWLKRTYQRLGEWDKSEQMYRTLYAELAKTYGGKLGVPPIEKWSPKGADAVGAYVSPTTWDITVRGEKSGEGQQKKRKSLLARARESWFGHHHAHHRTVVV